MSKKINVAVLMGGKSSEHEISLMSGGEVVKNLDSKKYNVFPINISTDGTNWQIEESTKFLAHSPTGKNVKRQTSNVKNIAKSNNASILKDNKIDIVFIALHGTNGEDGRIQGLLDLVDIPYTGSKVLASALAMNKILSRQILEKVGLKVPKYFIYKKTDNPKKILQQFNLPLIIKPPDQGSSIGVTKVVNEKGIAPALDEVFTYANTALVEEYVNGTEITVGVIGNDKPIALPLVEIVPKNDFFDYEAKYNESKCDEICPARVSKKVASKAQDIALKSYQSLGCEGFGRVDMIIRGGNLYVLEVNTIPGLTTVSLLPKAAKEAGISYSNLLDKIISYCAP